MPIPQLDSPEPLWSYRKRASKSLSLWGRTLGLAASLTLIHTCGPFRIFGPTTLYTFGLWNATSIRYFEEQNLSLNSTFDTTSILFFILVKNRLQNTCNNCTYCPLLHKKINKDIKVLPVSRLRCAGVTQYEVMYDTHIDVTCTPIPTVSHFNPARMQNGDALFSAKFVSEHCGGVCVYMCGQSPALFWNIFLDPGARAVGEEERGDWNVRSCRGGATVIWGVPWRRLSWGGESCDVDVSLSAKGWQSAKVKLLRWVFPVCVRA